MSRKRMVMIDGEGLKNFIYQQGKNLSEISRAIGHDNSYVKRSCRDNRIPLRELRIICASLEVNPNTFLKSPIQSDIDDFIGSEKDETAAQLPNPQRVKETLTKVAETMKEEEQPKKDDSWKDEPVFTWRELLEQYRRGYSEGFKTGRKEAHDEI